MGTVKRLTAKASLQRPIKDQILHVSEMFKFCKEKILGITFNLIMKDSMHDVREHLSKRYVAAETLPGTRSFHQFTPISQTTIGVKRVSEDSTYEKEFDFVNAPRPSLNLSELSVSSFTVALYDRKHWVGMVTDIDADHQEVLITFMHPPCPTASFTWPSREDILWVPITDVILKIAAPSFSTSSGRKYLLAAKDSSRIDNLMKT